MARTIVGVIIAAVVIFAWGFVYWGFGPYPTVIWKHTENDADAGQALATHFHERGTYFVPGVSDDPDEQKALYEKGPVAMVHMIEPNGRPMFDPVMMGQGFVLNLVVIVLVAILLHNVSATHRTYLGRVGLVTLAGIAAAVLIDGGDVVWWRIPWEWKLYQAFYNVSVWVMAGVILAAFIRPSAPQQPSVET